MITISDSKKEKMEECAEKAMKAIGKIAMCLQSCGDDDDDDDFGQRFDPDMYDIAMRYGGMGGGMGMRRGVRGTGPYSRFR